ncbi:AMP-binding protein [Halobacteriaceae archaeon GCM10025711]
MLADAPDDGPDRSPAPDDVAGVFYTGGTTGKPKGVVYTQACLAANVLAIPSNSR